MTTASHFQKLKMNWLLRVAGYPNIKPLAIVAAVAMANRANSKTFIVSAKLSTLAKDLGRSDNTGLSRGGAELVKLGFLKARKVGRKVIWTVDLDAAPKHPEESPKAKGHVKNLRTKVAQVRNYDACALAQPMEVADPDTDQAKHLRPCAGKSCAPAHLYTIPVVIPEGITAKAGFSQSLVMETEEQTKANQTDQDLDLDHSPDGAVNHVPYVDRNDTDRAFPPVSTADFEDHDQAYALFKEIYPGPSDHGRAAFEDAIDELGLDVVLAAAGKYASQCQKDLFEPMAAANWLRLGVKRHRQRKAGSTGEVKYVA